jgi:DNA helicase HerA-like ATPase
MALIEPGKVFVGVSGKPEYVHLPFANRHGLITGATGTGKTVSLQILAEGFSAAGVPVFCADVKGDVAGLSMAGEPKDFLLERAETLGFTSEYRFESFPVVFWDLFGKQGHPIRATVSEMGPLLLSRLLNLNDTQEGVLTIAFKIADDDGLLLLDLKDLQALLAHVAERASELTTRYGNVSKASVGAVQRALLVLEQQGGEFFFGEPALRIADLMRTSTDGRGIINILAADTLMQSPRLYATFLLWLLSELFDELPEIGDPPQPKLAFFFDEAHLLFNDAPKALLEKIELVVRLVRSKGVGVYFVSQNPLDVPDIVLAQIGNRVQHALRAFTPRDTKAVKAAAETFRANSDFSTFDVITELGTGEALVSTLEEKGVPSVVQRTLVRPPSSRIGAITPEERAGVIAASPVGGLYDQPVDRESAFEMLKKKVEERQPGDATPRETERTGETGQAETGGLGDMLDGIFGTGSSRSRRLTPAQRAAREATRTAAGEIGKAIGGASGGRILRSVLGGILGR